jgi:hypothetical protein
MKLRQLFEERKKKVVAVMPGGFHPFHPGHKSLYDWAVDTFGKPNVYVAATDDTKSRPFPFAIKQKLAAMAGVPTQRFIQVKSPFNALSYAGLLSDPENTALVFVRSEKDQTSHPKPDQIRKSDGQMGYIISYNGELEHGADMHGYMTYGPTIDFNFSGMDIKSASELRATWPEMDDESKAKAAELMYPGNGETASKLLNDALGDPEVPAEGVQEENNILDPLRGAAAELFGKQPKEEAPEKIALDQAMEKYKNNPKGLKAWLMKNRNILVWLNTSGGQMMDIVKQRIRETTTAGGIASSMGVMDAVPAESIQEDDNPAPNKIKPIKMSQPPKAPDATIPRSRDGHTKSDGTMYKQDKYNDNIMHVSNGGGTYTFDGSRLIRWKTPKINGYSQIHDFIKSTINVDANTSVTTKNPGPGTSTTVVDSNAVYDLKGNLIDKGELGVRYGGLGVSQSDKNLKINYNISPNLSMHIVADRKPVTPKVKQSMDAIVKSPNKDGTASNLIKIPMMAKKAGAKVIFKNSQGQSVPYDQAIAMMKKGKP